MKKYLFLLPLFISCFCKGQTDTTIGTAIKGGRDMYETTHLLCDGLSTEKEKANAIYNWITHNIQYDVKAFNKKRFTTDLKAEKAYRNRKALCEGYSTLFTEMCREAGLKAVNIEGYAKDWTFDNGDSLYIPRHMWTAVMIDGQWWLNDPTWGAGGLVQAPGLWRRLLNKILHQKVAYAKKLKFRYKYDPDYFMQDPEAFRFRHLPTDPLWQLTDTVMPIQFFEGGDSVVKRFNEVSRPAQKDPRLERIAQLDEKQKVFECADRAYQYNSRFPVILALKQTYRAESEVIKAFTDTTVQDGMLLVKDAADGLRKSQDYIKEQKKAFPANYARLKKKNATKNQETRQYIRQIRTDNKRLAGESKKYVHTADTKNRRVRTKYGEAGKRVRDIDTRRMARQEPAKIQKKTGSRELRELQDSVIARKQRIDGQKLSLVALADTIHRLQQQNSDRLDTLAQYLGITDSLLVQEAIARISMHDNYDDEVITFSRLYKDLKYKKADTLQKYYLAGFDTVAAMHERRQKAQLAVMDLYKKNLRSLEQYRKWNTDDTSVLAEYAECVNGYKSSLELYNKDLAAYAAYVKGNKKLFAYLEKLSKRQLRIADYMDKVEDRRKKLEEKKLADNKAFDIKENERQQAAVKELLDKLDEIAGGKHR